MCADSVLDKSRSRTRLSRHDSNIMHQSSYTQVHTSTENIVNNAPGAHHDISSSHVPKRRRCSTLGPTSSPGSASLDTDLSADSFVPVDKTSYTLHNDELGSNYWSHFTSTPGSTAAGTVNSTTPPSSDNETYTSNNYSSNYKYGAMNNGQLTVSTTNKHRNKAKYKNSVATHTSANEFIMDSPSIVIDTGQVRGCHLLLLYYIIGL